MTDPGGAMTEPLPAFDGEPGWTGGDVAGPFGAIVGKAGRVVTDTVGDGASTTNAAAAGAAYSRLAATIATKATSTIEPRIRGIGSLLNSPNLAGPLRSGRAKARPLQLDRYIDGPSVRVARTESLARAAIAR
jgi:hypothetical protein